MAGARGVLDRSSPCPRPGADLGLAVGWSRWLFGRAEARLGAGRAGASRSRGSATSASAARPAPAAARSPGWSGPGSTGRSTTTSCSRRSPSGMEVSTDEVAGLRRARPEPRAGLAPAAPRGALRPAGGLSRPPGQARRGDRPGGRLDRRRPGRGATAAAVGDAARPGDRPVEGPGEELGTAMGVSPRTARKAALDLDRRAAKFVKTMHRVDIADPHHYDLVLDSESLGLTIATEVIVRAVEMGRPAKTVVEAMNA